MIEVSEWDSLRQQCLNAACLLYLLPIFRERKDPLSSYPGSHSDAGCTFPSQLYLYSDDSKCKGACVNRRNKHSANSDSLNTPLSSPSHYLTWKAWTAAEKKKLLVLYIRMHSSVLSTIHRYGSITNNSCATRGNNTRLSFATTDSFDCFAF